MKPFLPSTNLAIEIEALGARLAELQAKSGRVLVSGLPKGQPHIVDRVADNIANGRRATA